VAERASKPVFRRCQIMHREPATFSGKRLLAILCVMGGTWLAGDFYQTRKAIPPPDVRSFDSYLLRMPAAKALRKCTCDGVEFTLAVGPLPGFPAVPSGSPCYVFDGSGALVDWTVDAGDNAQFVRRWANCFAPATSATDSPPEVAP